MGYFLSQQEWIDYELAVNSFMKEDAGNQVITWFKCVRSLNSKLNDDEPLYSDPIQLKGVIQYNEFRSWPINADTVTGEIDKESILVFLNNDQLREQGHLSSKGQFNFKPSLDRFEVNGVRYKSKGDSQTAQSYNGTLMHFMVMLRDFTVSGETKY